MKIRTVGIIGTGVIGSSWAAFYASKGFEVKLYDLDPSLSRKGLQRAESFLAGLARYGLLESDEHKKAASRMAIVDTLEQGVKEAQLVQESVAETYEVKHQVFTIMDAETNPEAILASSSSGLLMTEIQKVTRHPERCIIAHPFNPPHLIPLVELVPGKGTSETTLSLMKDFFEDLGKTPVVLRKETPGHIANRLAAALWREATDIVLKGIASVEDVDKAVCAGPGLRWALMGPQMIYHLGGGEGGIAHFFDHLGPAFETYLEDMATWTAFPPESKQVLVDGVEEEMKGRKLAELTRWRDEKLAGILKVIYS